MSGRKINSSSLRRWLGILSILPLLLFAYFSFNAVKIYRYASEYHESASDVAIVLGAGTLDGELSPVFRERLNHGIFLIQNQKVDYLILTGGYGQEREIADSEIAKNYVLQQGVVSSRILLERKSRYTIENLQEAQLLMDSLGLESALLVSDPLHMCRSVRLAEKCDIICKPSPTPSTMYRSFWPKISSLFYESFYYSLGELASLLQIEKE